ncbi:MAG: histidine kinase [Burkholderiales bacterium]|nr:histidine kinase [Burkholderiales bacterium]
MSSAVPTDSRAKAPANPPGGWRAMLRSLSHGKLGWTLGFAFTAALLLNPIFATPFPVVLGRAIFVALVSLLAFTVAGHWRQRWMPRWLVQALAIVIAVPLATLVVYMISTGGDLQAFASNPYRVSGFIWISSLALIIGLLLGLGAMVRERDAEARSLKLQFELERTQLERQALDARLALLTAQIEPHFLFNTLANVQALVETGSPRAAEVLKSLIAYLRAALPRLHQAGGMPGLGQEVALVRAYLELMHLRMPDRLSFRVDVPSDMLGIGLPAMALLTLVENAVRHGIDPAEEGGRIEVGAARAADGGVTLWVSDSGIGLSPKAAQGTGLTNLRARLNSVFGPDARLELSEAAPRGVRAEIHLPAPRK